METLLVLDVGGSSIKCGIWTDDQLIQLDSRQTPDTWEGMKNTFLQIQKEVNKTQRIEGVAISIPGSVNVNKGVIYGTSAIPYIHRFPIKKELSELFGLKVTLQNDANCAALAEVWRGNAADVSNSAFLIIGSGIGGAVVLNKQLIPGSHLFGGEFGYMVIDQSTGHTLSELGSPVAMAERFSKQRKDSKTYEGKDVFELAQEKDTQAEASVTDLYNALSTGIFNLAVSFDPDKVLIGGGISQRPDLIENLQSRFSAIVRDKHADGLNTEIQSCKFLSEANMVGAVYQFELEK